LKYLNIETLKHLNIYLKFKIYNLKFLRLKKFFETLKKNLSGSADTEKKQIIGASGYTLIEVVIVMMITAVVFVGIYSLFAGAMRADTESRYEIVAGELAQEGVELIKNIKEDNDLRWGIWNGGGSKPLINNNISSGNPYFDFDNTEININSKEKMQYDKAMGEYKINCSGVTCVGPVFERSCTTTSTNDSITSEPISLRITCTVEWESAMLNDKGKRKAVAETTVTDWER